MSKCGAILLDVMSTIRVLRFGVQGLWPRLAALAAEALRAKGAKDVAVRGSGGYCLTDPTRCWSAMMKVRTSGQESYLKFV